MKKLINLSFWKFYSIYLGTGLSLMAVLLIGEKFIFTNGFLMELSFIVPIVMQFLITRIICLKENKKSENKTVLIIISIYTILHSIMEIVIFFNFEDFTDGIISLTLKIFSQIILEIVFFIVALILLYQQKIREKLIPQMLKISLFTMLGTYLYFKLWLLGGKNEYLEWMNIYYFMSIPFVVTISFNPILISFLWEIKEKNEDNIFKK